MAVRIDRASGRLEARLRRMGMKANPVGIHVGFNLLINSPARARAKPKAEEGGPLKAVGGGVLSDEREKELLISILAGYPDRVARRRAEGVRRDSAVELRRDGSIELLLAGGGTAELAPESVVRGAEFLVAVDAEERGDAARSRAVARGAKTVVRLASAIEPDWLLDLFADSLSEKVEARWDARVERVEVLRRLVYDQLVVEEWRADKAAGDEVTRVLARAALDAGPRTFVESEDLERLLARGDLRASVQALLNFVNGLGLLAGNLLVGRLRVLGAGLPGVFAVGAAVMACLLWLCRTFPEARMPALGDAEAREALAEMCEGRRSFAELRDGARAGELLERLRRRLTPEQSRLLAQMAPERVALARGRQARVRYESGQSPYVASRLQDFFGMREGPRVAGGRAALVLQLLAPNQRPVQVTTDLAGFWSRHYPRVRRELSRRYPRHAWPEDPLQI